MYKTDSLRERTDKEVYLILRIVDYSLVHVYTIFTNRNTATHGRAEKGAKNTDKTKLQLLLASKTAKKSERWKSCNSARALARAQKSHPSNFEESLSPSRCTKSIITINAPRGVTAFLRQLYLHSCARAQKHSGMPTGVAVATAR